MGRTKCLNEYTLDKSDVLKYHPMQRIEVLSKDYAPVCYAYNTYHMFYEDQKIVCCNIYVNAFGKLSIDSGGALEYTYCDKFLKICSSNELFGSAYLNITKVSSRAHSGMNL